MKRDALGCSEICHRAHEVVPFIDADLVMGIFSFSDEFCIRWHFRIFSDLIYLVYVKRAGISRNIGKTDMCELGSSIHFDLAPTMSDLEPVAIMIPVGRRPIA